MVRWFACLRQLVAPVDLVQAVSPPAFQAAASGAVMVAFRRLVPGIAKPRNTT
jgi:hypothetical protein